MADAKMLKKVPVREQDPKVRATNFEEVCLGYNQEEAMEEAQRCLGCKKPKCVEGCPVSDYPPHFRLSVDVYVLRNPSVRVNVSAESKVKLFLSVSWRDLLLTMLWNMISNLLEQKLRTDIKLQ